MMCMFNAGTVNRPGTDTPPTSTQQSKIFTDSYRKGQEKKAADALAARGTQPSQQAERPSALAGSLGATVLG